MLIDHPQIGIFLINILKYFFKKSYYKVLFKVKSRKIKMINQILPSENHDRQRNCFFS